MLAGRPLFPGKNHHDQLWLILKCLGGMTERQLDLLDRCDVARLGMASGVPIACVRDLATLAGMTVGLAPTLLSRGVSRGVPGLNGNHGGVSACVFAPALRRDPQFACFRLPTASEVDPLESRCGALAQGASQPASSRLRGMGPACMSVGAVPATGREGPRS
jgi:hypothetical protein